MRYDTAFIKFNLVYLQFICYKLILYALPFKHHIQRDSLEAIPPFVYRYIEPQVLSALKIGVSTRVRLCVSIVMQSGKKCVGNVVE